MRIRVRLAGDVVAAAAVFYHEEFQTGWMPTAAISRRASIVSSG